MLVDFPFVKHAQCYLSIMPNTLIKEAKQNFTLGTKKTKVSGKSSGSLQICTFPGYQSDVDKT